MKDRGKITTELIYDTDSGITEFSAEVLSCEAEGGDFHTVLDRTAFFAEGGGQECDTGYIDGIRVKRVVTDGGRVVHITETPVGTGKTVQCSVDREIRLYRMAAHSAEHIVSAYVREVCGFENVGFHLGSTDVTADFDGVMTEEQIREIEARANAAVREDMKISVIYPDENELKNLDYRSKLDFSGSVRIVCIGDLDKCACCAPHISSTGRIGLITITEYQKYKGGTRVHILCGKKADERINREREALASACRMFSTGYPLLGEKLSAMLETAKKQTAAIAALNDIINEKTVSGLEKRKFTYLPDIRTDKTALRKLASLSSEKTEGLVAVIGGEENGSVTLVLSDARGGVREKLKLLSEKIGVKGGGSDTLVCCSADAGCDTENMLFELFGK